MSVCSVSGCTRDTRRRNYCGAHYQRVQKHGDPLAHVPIQDARVAAACSAPQCDDPPHSRGLCGRHYWRLRKYGALDIPERPAKAPRRWVSRGGYRIVYLPDHPMANTAGAVAEHRLIVAEALGRPLLGVENVHHINGDRLDNRLENLELWSRSQPSGQRVADKVAWAVQMLSLYRPDLLSAGASNDGDALRVGLNVG